ncbi:MAG: MBL fold metallo-hydrolase [bacterium]
MMISWHGLGCFSIKGKTGQREVTLVTDPYDNSVGLRFPRTLTASMVLQSHDAPEANNTDAVHGEEEGKPFLVTHAGEFEVKGAFAAGVRAPKKDGSEHTVYRIDLEGVSIAFLGALDRDLNDAELTKLGNIDVLILPVGGGPVIDKAVASDIVSQIEPRLVIPSYFDVQGLKVKLAGVEAFCKDLSCPREDANKLKIEKGSLPTDDIKVAVLTRA